jgi:hypothetical protein
MLFKDFLLLSLFHFSLSSIVIIGIKKDELDYYYKSKHLLLLNSKQVTPSTLIWGYLCEQNPDSDCFSFIYENVSTINFRSFLLRIKFI